MPKVSVIVPIYNVEAYIEKCVRSLFEQTLEDMEYIFVDDCSPDNSIQILKKVLLEYPSRKSSVKIIHLPYNQKQHKARIRGIEEAIGDYIIHCDPDDSVDISMYKTLYLKAFSGNYDFVWCGFKRCEKEFVEVYKEKCACDAKEILISLLEGKVMGSLWNKLVKKNIAKNISIINPESPYTEDLLLVSQYVMLSNSFYYCEGEFYNYMVHENSIISYYNSSDSLIEERVNLSRTNLILLHQAIYLHHFDKFLLPSMIRQKFNLKQSFLPLVIHRNSCSCWIHCFPEINISLFFCSRITFREKIVSILLLLHLYIIIRKFLFFRK